MQVKVDITETITPYLDKDGSSVRMLLRKLDSSKADIPIYNGMGFTEQVNVGFCSDKLMHGKIFNIDAVLETNQFIGSYVVKNPVEMLEMINVKKLYGEMGYDIKYGINLISPEIFLIPSRIIISQKDRPNTFTILAKEDPTMRSNLTALKHERAQRDLDPRPTG